MGEAGLFAESNLIQICTDDADRVPIYPGHNMRRVGQILRRDT